MSKHFWNSIFRIASIERIDAVAKRLLYILKKRQSTVIFEIQCNIMGGMFPITSNYIHFMCGCETIILDKWRYIIRINTIKIDLLQSELYTADDKNSASGRGWDETESWGSKQRCFYGKNGL